MPRPMKTDKPVIAEPVLEPIQSSTIVVIHPGSTVLRLGRATDYFPQTLPHVIARKSKQKIGINREQRSYFHRKGPQHEESSDKVHHGLKSAKTFIKQMRISGGFRKPRVSQDEISSYNSKVKPIAGDDDGSLSWTNVGHSPEFLIGDSVLNLPSTAPYSICWPMSHGQLNIHDGINGSLTSVATDLETIWRSAIETYLDIPSKDLNYYRAILLVPDIYDRNHIKTFMDILMNRLQFSCVILAQESVCGAFGSGLPSACVVDVGAQKTSICCVEDGISLPSTRLKLNYGGDDITRSFISLLQMSNFPYKSMDVNDPLDILLMNELKETFCHLSLDIPSGQVHEFQVMRPDENTVVYKLRLGDEPIIAPVAMFVPDVFGLIDEELLTTFPDVLDHDPQDLMDDRFLLEKRDVDTKKTKGDNESETAVREQQPQELIPLSQTLIPKEHARLDHLRTEGMPLDEAIMYTIEKCNNQETKRKMYSSVLVIGGGMSFKGADEFLLKRLQYQLPNHYQFMKDQMEVIVKPKENDPRNACWKGGAVLGILDSSQELWISMDEWNKYGLRLLRERCAFQLSTCMDKI